MRQRIIEHIQKNGPLSVADYMAQCLYDPQKGYYTTQMPFGKDGDFITAPELTSLFGEMLGLWVAATWQSMGSPETFHLVEFGPGRGVLCADMLRALQKAAPTCLNACQVHLVEISPHLTKVQQKNLQNAALKPLWHTGLTTLPSGPTIALGNEVLDAFPIHQYEKQQDGHLERFITTDGTNLFFTLNGPKKTFSGHKNTLNIVEKSPQMESFLKNLSQHLSKNTQSAALFIDYGTLNHIEGNGDSLQAIRKHQKESIFATPGHADLTWHIPFQDVCTILGSLSCQMTDMALFLAEIGLPLRAEQAHRAAKTQEQKHHIEATTQRLLDPNAMGRHFKVLGWRAKNTPPLAGFLHTKSIPGLD